MARKRRGRGEGGLYQRGDGYWVGSVSLGIGPNGKPMRKVVYGSTKAECLEKKREMETRLGRTSQDMRAIKKQTVKDYLQGWIATRTCDVGCKTRYQEHVRLWVNPIIGHVQIAKLQPSWIQHLYNQMEEKGASPNYIRRVGRMLRSALTTSGLAINPARAIPLPKVERPEVFPFTQEELGRLMGWARKGKWYDLYVLALDSGMRQGELFGLQWTDFDWETGSVMVQRSLQYIKGGLKTKAPKTKAGRRRIQLAPETMGLLRSRYEFARDRGLLSWPVFHAETGNWIRQPNFLRDSWYPLCKRADVEHHRFHDLRHTCATQLLLAAENPKVVSLRLGHSKVETTLSIYAHVLDAMQESATQKMSNLLGKVLPREEEE